MVFQYIWDDDFSVFLSTHYLEYSYSLLFFHLVFLPVFLLIVLLLFHQKLLFLLSLRKTPTLDTIKSPILNITSTINTRTVFAIHLSPLVPRYESIFELPYNLPAREIVLPAIRTVFGDTAILTSPSFFTARIFISYFLLISRPPTVFPIHS